MGINDQIKRSLMSSKQDWEDLIKKAERHIEEYKSEIYWIDKRLENLKTTKDKNGNLEEQLINNADTIARALTEGIYDKTWDKHYDDVSLEYDYEDGFVLVVYDYNYYRNDNDPAGFDFKIQASDHLPLSDFGISWGFRKEDIRQEEHENIDEFEEDDDEEEVEEDD